MTGCRYSGWLRGCGWQGWLSLLLLLPLLASAQPDEAALRTKDIELKRLREQITHLQSTLRGERVSASGSRLNCRRQNA